MKGLIVSIVAVGCILFGVSCSYAVGDFNGDGKDDIVTFVRLDKPGKWEGDVWVALSNGSEFGKKLQKWHDAFCGGNGNEIPAVGDFNGDGKDDIITFVRLDKPGKWEGDVWIALSNGSKFGKPQKWHDAFCGGNGNEIPAVGDFNGDGKDDIVTFVRNDKPGKWEGDVWIALSNGSKFGKPQKWHDAFCYGNEIPAVGDLDGDGDDDIAFFTQKGNAKKFNGTDDVYVALSNGKDGFYGHETRAEYVDEDDKYGKIISGGYSPYANKHSVDKWHDNFCTGDEVPTTFAAIFPYYMFPLSQEDEDNTFVVYVSNEDGDLFVKPGYAFLDEFKDKWKNTQYYWGQQKFLQEYHLNYVDSADLAYIGGHGNVSYISLSEGEGCDLTRCAWGSWSSHNRKGDLEYIVFNSCLTLSVSGNWRERWKSTPNKKRPFSGLHMALGYCIKVSEDIGDFKDITDGFAENLIDGHSVRWSWLEAVEDEMSIWDSHLNPCVMYIRDYKDDTISKHNKQDRWYHHSDYLLDAQYMKEYYWYKSSDWEYDIE
jgi:hypothetical protein